MDSKKPKREARKIREKKSKKAISIVGALSLAANLPVAASESTGNVAERIARIREAFARSSKSEVMREVSLHSVEISDSAAKETPREKEEIASQFANFTNFSQFSNFSNFNDAFNNFGNGFGNFGNAI